MGFLKDKISKKIQQRFLSTGMVSKKAKKSGSDRDERRVRGRTGEGASFPAPPAARDMPHDYALILEELKSRIQEERLRIVLSANAAMVLLYWDIGRLS